MRVNPLSSDNTTKLYNPVFDACSLKHDSPSVSLVLFPRFCGLIMKLLCSVQLEKCKETNKELGKIVEAINRSVCHLQLVFKILFYNFRLFFSIV